MKKKKDSSEEKPIKERLAHLLADFHKRRGKQPVEREPTESEIRDERFQYLMPSAFRATQIKKLPCAPGVVKAVLAHPILETGLRLAGDTGGGKTRLAWLLLGKVYSDGANFSGYDGGQFGALASGAYRDGTEAEFFRRLTRSQILFLDDVGKGKMTARVTEALFTIVDRRGAAQKPILMTMNYTLETLSTKLLKSEDADPETVEALIRRMRENMKVIAVKRI